MQSISRRLKQLLRDSRGTAVIEFAVASPVLMLMSVGVLKFGLVVGQHVMLTHAAAQAASTLSLSRGTSVPYSSTVSAISSAAPALQSASVGKVITVNGTACSSDSACSALLSVGTPAQVQVSYTCDLSVMGIDFKPNCTLTATSTQMIQ